jgi:chemotaxis regulatin CheY-phosphate phosphatase CheZ
MSSLDEIHGKKGKMMATSSKSKTAKASPAVKKAPAKPAVRSAAKPAAKPATKPAAAKKPAPRKPVQATGEVLSELKLLAKELNQAAKGLSKRSANNPKEVSAILGNVERMTAEAANKSLLEAESAKEQVNQALASLGKEWSRKQLEELLGSVSRHLTNIIVAQEFQDLAGQSLRKAMKALVGAIIVVEGGGPTEDQRLSQKDVDSLLKELMP